MDMIKEKRYERIRSELARKGSVDVEELADLLQISRPTVRRDLHEMQERGYLRRTHGGAIVISDPDELPFQSKVSAYLSEKRAIGAMTASLIPDGRVIGCTGGTTVMQVMKALKGKTLTVVTNAVNIAMELAPFESLEVIITGGTLRTRSYEMVGHIAERTIRSYHLDIALIGVDGLDLHHGLSTFTDAEAYAAALYIEHAREVWVVADHSKIGKTAPALIAPLSRVSRLITDSNMAPDQAQIIRESGIALTLAEL
jgi:DeoR/GlpR family transcriptional regulator of sugar metabolism